MIVYKYYQEDLYIDILAIRFLIWGYTMFFRRKIEGEIVQRISTEDFLDRPVTLYTLLNGKFSI